jgi:CheY-like chemotaxis protein
MQGSVGLDLARAHRPDLILLDLHLPDMAGAAVLKALQADADTSDIPVVVMSADATPSQIRALLATGARAYLTKPLDVREFLAVIGKHLNQAKSPR